MKNQHLSEEEIALVAEAINSDSFESLPKDLKAHIVDCDQCAAEVATVSELIDDHDINIKPKSSLNLFLKIVINIAALLVLLAGLYFIFHEKSIAPSTIAHNSDSTQTTKLTKATIEQFDSKENKEIEQAINKNQENQLLLAYNENPKLEKIYHRFQEGAMRSSDIKILTDSVLKVNKTKNLNLKWENPYGEELTIEVFNNKGDKILDKTVNKQSLSLTRLQKPGLYYWKIFNSDFDLLYCGKIILSGK